MKKRSTVRSSAEFVDMRRGIAVLEGPADRAAAKILAGAGVLRVFEDDGANDQVLALQGTKGDDASSLVEHALDTVGLVDPSEREIVMEAAYEALRVDFCTSYLIGVAVGRRLGPQSFTAGGSR